MLHITFSKYDCIVHKAYYLFTCTCVSINSFHSHSHSHIIVSIHCIQHSFGWVYSNCIIHGIRCWACLIKIHPQLSDGQR